MSGTLDTPQPADFADRGRAASAPNSSAPLAPRPQRTPTPGKSSEASTSGKTTYEQIGENVKTNALSGAYQEFAGDLNFGRPPRPAAEQNGDSRSRSAAPPPTGDKSQQASVLQFFEHQSKQDSSYKQNGNNYLSNVSKGGYQSFGGSLSFSD